MNHPLRSARDDAGFALMVVVLLLWAGTVVTHGLLELARVEHATAVTGRDVVQARLAARSGALESAQRPTTTARRAAAAGAVVDSVQRNVGRIRVDGRLRRLSLEVWLAEGRGRSGTAEHATARAVWILDPHARVDAFPAVVVAGRAGVDTGPGGITGADTFADPDPRPPGGCGPFEADSLSADTLHATPTAWIVDTLGSFTGLGRITRRDLASLRLDSIGGTGTPMPSEALGRCFDADPWNWGDPLAAGRWCRDYRVMMHAPGFLEVNGGVGQGLLVLNAGGVLRDLEFFGVVLSDGPLRIAGTTILRGLIVARGGLTIEPGAQLRGSACWAWAALNDPRLATPRTLPGGGWMWVGAR